MTYIQNEVPVRVAAVLEAAKTTIGQKYSYSYLPDDFGLALPIIVVQFDNSIRDTEKNWMEVEILCWWIMMDDDASDLNPAIRQALSKMEQSLIDDWNLSGLAIGGLVMSEAAMVRAEVLLGKVEDMVSTSVGVLKVTYRVLDLDLARSNR